MKKLIAVPVLALVFGAAACDSEKEGKRTATKIEQAIKEVCVEGGPRTITPIDLDGQHGPTGYLVTCVSGKVQYVKATS